MYSIQAIFNVILDGGFFFREKDMCNAAYCAMLAGDIDQSQYSDVIREIADYLKLDQDDREDENLESSLIDSGLPHEYEDRRWIYQNWDKRPALSI